MPQPIHAVFLDFQDTLARFKAGAWNSSYGLYVEAAREHGIDIDAASVVLPTDEAWADFQTPAGPAHPEYSSSPEAYAQVRIAVHGRRLARAGVTGVAAESIARRIDELEAQAERYELFDDVLPAMERLHDARVRVLIVSNHIWGLDEIVEALGLRPHVHEVVNSAVLGYRKPHPAVYEEALTRSGVPAGETVMVGDSLGHDVMGAERHGIHGVFLDREGHRQVPDGTRVISTLLDVPLAWH